MYMCQTHHVGEKLDPAILGPQKTVITKDFKK